MVRHTKALGVWVRAEGKDIISALLTMPKPLTVWITFTDSMNINLSKLWEMVKDREVWRAAVLGVTKSRT